MKNRTYIAIDLKSFYASVECVKRGYDPLTTNLVVADESRTDKTICLAVSPSLKAHGVSGRARLFEVIQRVRQVNAERRRNAPGGQFTGRSVFAPELARHPELELDYIVAVPQMAHYMEWSSRIYSIYLRYIAAEDIHVYSIDEVFMDVTDYLSTYRMTPRELAMTMIHDVLNQTGITATAGIGSNLYLCKVAMDIVAKHIPADENGVRIAELDEISYRKKLWEHRPLTDFWRVGSGYRKKLEAVNLRTMGDIAQYSMTQSGRDHLYRLFGVNAELLIDHAWGCEPCTMKAIKEYGAERKSLGAGQVLPTAYSPEKARLVTREMADALSLDLAGKHLITDQIVLTIGYDRESLKDPEVRRRYHGNIRSDRYGRNIPEHAHGTINLSRQTASTILITEAAMELFDRIINPDLLVRRITITAGKILPEDKAEDNNATEQLNLFTDYDSLEEQEKEEEEMLEKEKRRQEAILTLQKKYGKNIVLKGMNLEKGATMRERNGQVGGHKA